MKRVVVCLVLLAACKGDARRVPDRFKAMVPTEGLTWVGEHKDYGYGYLPGVSMFYGDRPAEQLRAAYRERLAALDGYQLYIDCGADDGFAMVAVKEPQSVVEIEVSRLGSDAWKADLSVGELESLTLPEGPGCAWLPAAKPRCPSATDPRYCSFAAP